MPRILSIDYGLKRTGLAVSDENQKIAFPLKTVATSEIIPFIQQYLKSEKVSTIIIGYPVDIFNRATDATPFVEKFIKELSLKFPALEIQKVDERFSSKNAVKAMLDMGMKKKERRIKGNTDLIASTMILQNYLQYNIKI